MAPEVILGNGKPYVGTTVDIFSMGICLFFMLKGSPPFQRAE